MALLLRKMDCVSQQDVLCMANIKLAAPVFVAPPVAWVTTTLNTARPEVNTCKLLQLL